MDLGQEPEVMEFRGRQSVLTTPELEQLLRVAPTVEAFRAGFTLRDADVDEVIRAAKDLEGAQVFPEPAYGAEGNVDLLLRTVRLLQTALDVQFKENDSLIADFNALRDETQELEERERRLQEDNDRLRELRDRDQANSDVNELRRKIDDLQHRLEEESRNNDRMRSQRDRDEQRIKDLDYRVQRADEDLRDRDDQLREVEEQLARLSEDYSDLRQTYEALRAEHALAESKLQVGDTLRQQDWKIERMTKESRALEHQNAELRKQLHDVKTENLEVSEKIVLLDEEMRGLRSREADFEARMETAAQDRAALLAAREELRAEVQDKVALLDEFEDKFNRQYKSWEEEKAGLTAQIEGLHRELKGLPARRTRSTVDDLTGASNMGSTTDELQELCEQLHEAKEKEVLLLEAYEQLEQDVGAEVDRALSQQTEELQRLQRRVDFLQARLEEAKVSEQQREAHVAHLQEELQGAQIRNRMYQEGTYGLPQAVDELHALKDALHKEQDRVQSLVMQLNKVSAKVEDLHDENAALRRRLGLGDAEAVDISDLKMQREATVVQLRSLNALLERQVADLEEERRKLRMEMKFRAKYHGQSALELGLSPNQLLMVEQYVDDLKHGRSNEARIVDGLQRRIEFLELRLSEVMAYADIPPSMRPPISEFDPLAHLLGGPASAAGQLPGMMAAAAAGRGGSSSALSKAQLAQLQAVKGTLLKSLKLLRDMDQALGTHPGSYPEQKTHVHALQHQLTAAERTLDAVLRDVAAATAAAAGGKKVPVMNRTPVKGTAGADAGAGVVNVEGDASFLADAMADQLRERLRELAKQVADLQAQVIMKDEQVKQLTAQKCDLEQRLGLPVKDKQPDHVPKVDYDELALEAASLKEQLVSVLEELSCREREVSELQDANLRQASKMQTFADQVKMVYREHANNCAAWKVERNNLNKQVKRLQEQADGYKLAAHELQRCLDTLDNASGTADATKEYIDTVRRMAVVQIKHAKIARELEASVMSEKAQAERIQELEEEVRDISSTCRNRMRWLEVAAEQAQRRVEQLFRELQASAPLAAYLALVQKHAQLQDQARQLLEEQAGAVLAAEGMLQLREDLAELMQRYDALCSANAEAKERNRQLELLLANSANSAALQQRLNQELVAARVLSESAGRRMELLEKERDRGHRTAQEAQARLQEVEEQLAQNAAELERLRVAAAELQHRLLGALPKPEADELWRRLDVAEQQASKVTMDAYTLHYRAEEAERSLQAAKQERQAQLAEITSLKAALRDAMGRGDQAALIGKLHLELDHNRAKETLARSVLNRSELQRLELDSELRHLKQEMAKISGRMVAHQDQARWCEKQRQEAQALLDIGLAGSTQQWKARLWSRKLEQLKARNDALADSLDVARRRIKKLEDLRLEAELKLEAAQDVEVLVSKGAPELVRDAARLTEALMQAKMERGKLQREEVLLREKVHYVERVNAELHELLEKYEAEYFQHQMGLDAEKAVALAHACTLQGEVARLQDRIAGLLAGSDTDHDQDRKPGRMRASQDQTGRLKHMLSNQAGGFGGGNEREIMLKQIESLKNARQEAEHLRLENGRLANELSATTAELADVRRHHNDALQRLKEQSEALLYALQFQKGQSQDDSIVDQMKAVAEATIAELQSRLKQRDKDLADLAAQLEALKARGLEQHAADRAEIERLNQKLFERNDASIHQLKGVLDRMPLKEHTVASEVQRLREVLERKQDELNLRQNQLEQKDAAIEVLRNSYEQQIRKLQGDIARLEAELAKPRDDAPSKLLVGKLNSQLRGKDEKLRQLKEAIKQLEQKLIEALKKNADQAMQESSWKLQEQLEQRVAELEAEKLELLAALQALRDELEAHRSEHSGGDTAIQRLRDQIQSAHQRNTQLEVELSSERAALQKYKNVERTVVDLTTGMSIEAKRQIEELQRRLNVLERQNQTLKRTLQAEEGRPASSGAADTKGFDSWGSRPLARRATLDSRSEGGAAAPGHGMQPSQRLLARVPDPPGSDIDATQAGANTRAVVLQWEENKKLTAKLEGIRKKLALKTEEVAEKEQACIKLRNQVKRLQAEVDRQAAALRDQQERARRAAVAARPGPETSKLHEYASRMQVLEEEVDSLKAELARQQQRQKAASTGGAGTSALAKAADDQLARDSELFELRLQRDQAQAQVTRLKARLEELFGTDADADGAVGRAGPGSRAQQQAGSKAAGSSREAELLGTVTTLKAALDKAMASSIPTTKHMAEVAKRKEAQREAAALAQEAEKLRAQGATASRMVSELQASNAQLRAQARALQVAAGAAAAAVPRADAEVQLAQLQVVVAQQQAELRQLQAVLADREEELANLAGAAGGASPGDLLALRARLEDLEAENHDLKNELNAFDPGFFEEIEDLKHEHHQLSMRMGQYEDVICQLSAQLGRPPPAMLAASGSGRGR